METFKSDDVFWNVLLELYAIRKWTSVNAQYPTGQASFHTVREAAGQLLTKPNIFSTHLPHATVIASGLFLSCILSPNYSRPICPFTSV